MKKKIKIPLYGGRLHVLIEEDIAILKGRYPELGNTDLSNWGAITFWSSNRNDIYCAFSRKEMTPGLIAHEAKHAVNQLFIRIGHYLDRENDEPETYLLSWVVNRITELQNGRK